MLLASILLATLAAEPAADPTPAPVEKAAAPTEPAAAPVPAPAPVSAAPPAPPAPAKESLAFEFHGFVGASIYGHDANFQANGGGQSALFVVPPALKTDKLSLGADVRQSRISFSVTAPKLSGIGLKAMVELDFFGGDSLGSYGDVSLLPRLRVVYADVTYANTTLRAGQDHELLLGVILPTTVGHMAFPLTYGAGTLGWRYPGITLFQNVPVTADQSLEFALQVTRSNWAAPQILNVLTGSAQDAAAGTAKNTSLPGTFGLEGGSASGLPAMEARVKYKSKPLEAFVAGHWSRIDRSGAGATFPEDDSRDVLVANAGFKLVLDPVTVQGAGYFGKNSAPMLGNLLQFQSLAPGVGDIRAWGAWGQVGVNVVSGFSAWALAGTEHPDYEDVRKAGQTRLQNTVLSGMLRYQLRGYLVGLEYTHWYTKTLVDAAGAASATGSITGLSGNQLMLSGVYVF